MKRTIILLIFIILNDFSILFAVGSYEILNFPQDSYSLSLHNSISSYDQSFSRNNPASISMNISKIMYSYLRLPSNIHSIEIQRNIQKNNFLKFGRLSLINYGKIIDSKTNNQTSSFDFLVEIGFKKELANIISLGISGGNLISSISGYNSQLLYTNIGIRSRFLEKRMGLGFSIENLGMIISSYTDYKENIPSVFRSSVYYIPKYLHAIIGLDIIKHLASKNKIELSTGIELILSDNFSIRLGSSSKRNKFFTGDFTFDAFSDISGGFGFNNQNMIFDIGFMNLGAAGYIIGFSISKISI